MKKTPGAVIPMPLDRVRKFPRRAGRGAIPRLRPIRALVVGPTAFDRQVICRAGRQAAGSVSEWIEAADGASAAQILACSEIDLLVADPASIRCMLRGMASAGHTGSRRAPLVVAMSEEDEPCRIQETLDAGAECYLPKHLPRRILESELRRLVMMCRRTRPIPITTLAPCEEVSSS